MRSIIKIDGIDEGMEVKEGYETVKKRLYTAGEFIEVTNKAGKLTIAKNVIDSVKAIDRVMQVKPTKKGKDIKVTTTVNDRGGKETLIV